MTISNPQLATFYSRQLFLVFVLALLIMVPVESRATRLCMQEGLNLAYSALPAGVVSCLALEIEDISQPPASSRLASKSIYSNPWAYANLAHACTTKADQDVEKLLDTYLDEALIQSRKYCKESIDFEFEDSAFYTYVFGKDYSSSDSGVKSQEKKFTASMSAPLTLGRGRATAKQIDGCFLHGAMSVSGMLADVADLCKTKFDSSNVDSKAALKRCRTDKGTSYSELERKMQDALVENAGNHCIVRFNYRLNEEDIQNWKPDPEKIKREGQEYREAAETMKALIGNNDSK